MRISDWSSDVCSSDLRARLYRVHMRHQPHIVAVIGAHVRQIIAERLPLRIMLAEIGPAAVEWMPPRVDDLRIRQDQADQRRIEPVVRQLVDIEGLARPALHRRAAQEGRSEEHTSELQSLMR